MGNLGGNLIIFIGDKIKYLEDRVKEQEAGAVTATNVLLIKIYKHTEIIFIYSGTPFNVPQFKAFPY
jgi:hypothetical protein